MCLETLVCIMRSQNEKCSFYLEFANFFLKNALSHTMSALYFFFFTNYYIDTILDRWYVFLKTSLLETVDSVFALLFSIWDFEAKKYSLFWYQRYQCKRLVREKKKSEKMRDVAISEFHHIFDVITRNVTSWCFTWCKW